MGLLLIAAVMLVTMTFAGAASADATVTTQDELKTALTAAGSATVTLGNAITIDESQYADISIADDKILDLNGYTLTIAVKNRFATVESGKNFTIKDGSANGAGRITNGTASGNGGCVYIKGGTFTLESGTIDNCTAYKGGGVAVTNKGRFVMKGGSIIDCVALNSVLSSGSNGGGVYVDENCKFEMEGGTITRSICGDDRRYDYGGGVYVKANAKFNVSGTATVTQNFNGTQGSSKTVLDDVSLRSNNDLQLVGNFFGKIGIFTTKISSSTPESPKENSQFGVVVNDADGAKNFFADNTVGKGMDALTGSINSNKKLVWAKPAYVEVDSWDELVSAASGWTNKDLMRTIVLTNSSEDAYKNMTGTPGKYGGITVAGNVTVMPAKDAGKITIDANLKGRIFSVNSGASLTVVENGSSTLELINGNVSADNNGGCVYVNGGTFTLESGTIDNCTAGKGGGVAVTGNGRFVMNGGSITNCVAFHDGGANGGGVYVNENSKFEMNGGTITGCICGPNRAHDYGGGVYVKKGGKFNVSGTATVTQNFNGTQESDTTVLDDVSLRSDDGLQLVGKFNGKIGIFSAPITGPGGGGSDTPVPPKDSVQFGKVFNDADGAENFFDDNTIGKGMETLTGSIGGTKNDNLVWTKPAYVEVATWDDLVSATSGWTHKNHMRTIVLTNSSKDAYKNMTGDPGAYIGIPVDGNVSIMPARNAGKITIDANDKGRIFIVGHVDSIQNASLTLSGNGSSTLELIHGNASLEIPDANHDGKGGAIYVCYYNGKLAIHDGVTITNSTAAYNGGGVYLSSYNGKEIPYLPTPLAATISIDGKVNIIGNTNGTSPENHPSNLYLKNYTSIAKAHAKLNLVGDLTGRIGFGSGADKDFIPVSVGQQFGTVSTMLSGAENLVHDTSLDPILDPIYVGKITGDEQNSLILEWAEGHMVTFDPNNGEDVWDKPVENDTVVAEPTTPVRQGYTFSGWYNGYSKWDFTTTVTENLTLIAKWEKNSQPYTPSHKESGQTVIQQAQAQDVSTDPTPANQATADITVKYIAMSVLGTSTSDSAALKEQYPEAAAQAEIAFSTAQAAGIPLTNSKGAKAVVVTSENIPNIEKVTFSRVYEISPANAGEKLTKVTVKVPKSDITAKGLTSEDVNIYHYLESYNIWVPLETLSVSQDDSNYYYTAATDGTSPFGVLVKKIGGDDTTVPTTQPTQTQKSPAPLAGIIAGLGAATLFLRLRK